MNMAGRIKAKLDAGLAPLRLEIVDESASHAGHSGAAPGGETHFRVTIIAQAFAGQSRVDRQRRVYALLADELNGGVHALALATQTPEEADR
jgi:BolA protein